MPFSQLSNRIEKLWSFVDRFSPGEAAPRQEFDAITDDLVASINEAIGYLEAGNTPPPDRYMGAFASAPTQGPGGGPLLPGDFYFNTTTKAFMVRDGNAWVASVGYSPSTWVKNNVLGAQDAEALRAALELGTAALADANSFSPLLPFTNTAFFPLEDITLARRQAVTDFNLNNFSSANGESGWMVLGGGCTNAPPGIVSTLNHALLHHNLNSNTAYQVYRAPGQMWIRDRAGGTWSAWRRIAEAAQVAPMPVASAGANGFFNYVATAVGAAYSLPAGGKWAWLLFCINGSTGATNAAASGAGVADGGVSVRSALAGHQYVGLVWKITE